MTVRANKPAFSIREKLKELQKPIGLKGSELMRAETAQEARDLVSAGRKNLIINGDMRISQRGTTFNPVASSTGIYTIDRFCTQSLQSNNFTITQDSSSPPGFLNNWKITMGTATTLNYTRLCATVEGYHFKQASAFGTSLAKHLTLSFWVKSSLTGTFGIGFRNGTTIQGTGLSTSLLSTYTINSANTWEYKTITIPPNTEATWGLSNNIGFLIIWDLGDSNTRSSSVTNTWQTSDSYYPVGLTNGTKVASVTGATWQITGVQLEVGKNATEFEHRSYGEELALCQRYFQAFNYGSLCWMSPRSPQGTYTELTYGSMKLKTTMRASPTIGVIGTSFQGVRYNGSGYSASTLVNPSSNITLEYAGLDCVTPRPTWNFNWTVNDLINFVVSANDGSALTFSAEL